MERKFEIAVRTNGLRASSDSRECEGTLGVGPLERNVCLQYTCYCESSKSLEGDCKQGGKLDYSRYSQESLLTLCYH